MTGIGRVATNAAVVKLGLGKIQHLDWKSPLTRRGGCGRSRRGNVQLMALAFCIVPRRGRGCGTVSAVGILLRSMVQMVATADGFGPTSRPMPRALWRHAVGSIPWPHGLIATFAPSSAGLSW